MSLASDIGSTNPELLQLLSDMSRTDAWAEFVDRYGPMIHRICAKWSLPFHEREEIRSHVLIKIVETFLKPELRIRTSFRGYLFQMITNEILLHLRKKRKNANVILLENDQLELFGEFSNLLAEQIQSIETDIFERLASLQTVFDHVRQRTSSSLINTQENLFYRFLSCF